MTGLCYVDRMPMLLHPQMTFPNFDDAKSAVVASPITDAGVIFKWSGFLKELTGILAPSTLANKLRSLRWWLLYRFLSNELRISESAMGQIWMAGGKKLTQLSHKNGTVLRLKQMNGATKYPVYRTVRVQLNRQLLEVNKTLIPFTASTEEKLDKEDELFVATVLATALLVLTITPRIQAVSKMVGIRHTAAPSKEDVSALMFSDKDWSKLIFVLCGGKGKDHHDVEDFPLHTTLSELLLVWDCYTLKHLSATPSRYYFTSLHKAVPVSDLSSRVRDNLVNNLGMILDDETTRICHAVRDLSFGTFAALVSGDPAMLSGIAEVAHTSIGTLDKHYVGSRNSEFKSNVKARYIKEMNLTDSDYRIPLPPPPLPYVVSNKPEISAFAIHYAHELLFGVEAKGDVGVDNSAGRTDKTDCDEKFVSHKGDLEFQAQEKIVCPNCALYEDKIQFMLSFLQQDQQCVSRMGGSSSSSGSSSSGSSSSSSSSSSSNFSSSSSSGSSSGSSCNNSSRSSNISSSSSSSDSGAPRLDWNNSGLVGLVCELRAAKVPFSQIVEKGQEAGLIPVGYNRIYTNRIKGYYYNILLKSSQDNSGRYDSE
jgi:hypothetical protein